jgi:hypothetical protein
MEFKEMKELSPKFNELMNNFIDRVDCFTGRDRELFYDLIGFAFDEGKIKGKEEVLIDFKASTSEIKNNIK